MVGRELFRPDSDPTWALHVTVRVLRGVRHPDYILANRMRVNLNEVCEVSDSTRKEEKKVKERQDCEPGYGLVCYNAWGRGKKKQSKKRR